MTRLLYLVLKIAKFILRTDNRRDSCIREYSTDSACFCVGRLAMPQYGACGFRAFLFFGPKGVSGGGFGLYVDDIELVIIVV